MNIQQPAIKDPDVAEYERCMAAGETFSKPYAPASINPKKRGHVLHKPVPVGLYAKVNVHEVTAPIGYDKNGKEIQSAPVEVATYINPLNNRRATRKARKAAKLAALVH